MAGRMTKALVAIAGLLLMGCTDFWDDSSTVGRPLAPGHYRLVFSVDPSAATTPIGGVGLTLPLPKGVTVPTSPDGSQILSSALTTGSGVKGTCLIVGRYLASKNQVALTLTAAPDAGWSGEFARMTITIPAGVSLSERALVRTVGSGFPACKVVGLAGSTHDSVSLADRVHMTVSLMAP